MASETELKAIIGDASLPGAQRRDAAVLYVRLALAGVPAPGEDDPAVVELMTPWSDRKLAELWAVATEGRSVSGYALAEAKAAVLRKLKRQRLTQLAADTAEASLVRDAAAAELAGPATRRA